MDRRRSVRLAARLPVRRRDHGERLSTKDVSAHGLLVETGRPWSLREHVELELTLPEGPIWLSARVACHHSAGAGLDLVMLDPETRRRWLRFVESAAPAPAFLVRPRDLARLWTFYRGELNRAALRLESPMDQDIGARVEVLVAHPTSGAEWSFRGEVIAVAARSSGRTLLDVALLGVDTAVRAAFRSFVASGALPSPAAPPVLATSPPPEPPSEELLPSVVVELEDDDDPGFAHEETTEVESERAPAVVCAPTTPQLLELSLIAAGSDAAPPELRSPAPAPLDPASLDPASLDPASLDPASLERANLESPPVEHWAPVAGSASPPTGVFAAFFEEAARAPVLSPRPSRPPSASEPELGPSTHPVAKEERSGLRVLPRVVARRPPGSASVVVSGFSPRAAPALRSVAPPPGSSTTEGPQKRLAVGGPAGFGPKVRRNAANERQPGAHLPVSTAGTNPELDRDIALARARVVRSPEDPGPARALARLLYDRARPETVDEAATVYARVLELAPTDEEALSRSAELSARAGRYGHAQALIERAKAAGAAVDPDLAAVVERALRRA